MPSVFLVQHVHAFEDGEEDIKIIGIYTSRELAQAAVARSRPLLGFRDTPEGFEISQYDLDSDHWTEGYISVAEAMADD